MKTPTLRTALYAATITAALLMAGCSSKPAVMSRVNGSYMQKQPVRVAIMPSFNKTQEAGAAIELDKAWEAALKTHGYEVVSADTVVNLAASQGINLNDFERMKLTGYAAIGKDLGVDYILESTILKWGGKYRIVSSKTEVQFSAQIFETKTGAVIWNNTQDLIDTNSNSGGGNPIGMLIGMAVHAAVNSAVNASNALAIRGTSFSSAIMPKAGFVPGTK